MNRSIFWRLFWKEYRLQRALWIAVAVLTALLMLLVDGLVLNVTDRIRMIFGIATTLPAFYCLGCGATLFAGEHEAGVFEFHRSLPVRTGWVFAVKIAFAILSIVLLFGLMWLAARWLSGGMPFGATESKKYVTFIVGVCIFGLGMFLWATFFSLLLRRVIVAAVLGVAAASIHLQLIDKLPGLGITLAVIVADCWLGVRWFREKRHRRPSVVAMELDGKKSMQAAALSSHCLGPTRTATLGRLIWQHWRQSVYTMLVLAATIVLLAAFPADKLILPYMGHSFWRGGLEQQPLYMLALACVPLLGACAFLADQRGRRFRFLAERGVPPKYVWLSRQLVPLAPIAVVLPLLLCVMYFLAPEHWVRGTGEFVRRPATALTFVFGYVVISFAAGQLCSMFFRSSILAGLFSVFLAVVLAGWWGLMLFWHVNWLWSTLPIPLAMLLATRLRTADWLLQRNKPRAWLLPGLVLVFSVMALLTAVPLYRIYQVPAIAPGFCVEELDRPMTREERATLDLYRQAIVMYPHRKEALFKKENPEYAKASNASLQQEAIALLIKASKQELSHPIEGQSPLRDVAGLLLIDAEKVEREGQLDAALERYLAAIRVFGQIRRCDLFGSTSYFINDKEVQTYAHLSSWAARPNQTPERIMAVERQLRQINSHISPVGPIELQYVFLRRVIEGDPMAIGQIPSHNHTPSLRPITMLWLRLPWERARAVRLLNVQTRYELGMSEGVDDRTIVTSAGWYVARYALHHLAFWKYSELLYTLRAQINLPPISRTWDDEEHWRWDLTVRKSLRAVETARRAAHLVLALEAYKLQHGSLPKSLDQLVGPYLDSLPIDPYTREPFRYFRNGLKIPLRYSHPRWRWYGPHRPGEIPADAPFIWSVGAKIRVSHSPSAEESILNKYSIKLPWPYEYFRHRATRIPTSEYDVWSSGWPFPIP